MRKVLIIGATSAIAQAAARLFAADGDKLFLVARDSGRLSSVAEDLKVRGAAEVREYALDLTETARHQEMLSVAEEQLGGLDLALVAHGSLPDQAACESSFETTRSEFETNCLSAISLLTHLANLFQERGGGSLVAISSPAGDRGRQSNYVYGAAKGAVSIFMQGLRNRLQPHGVHVLTVKPGFVDTPMTAEFTKGALWVQPEVVAKGLYRAIIGKRDSVYLPWFWFFIMTIIKSIPEPVFKRLKL